MLFKNALLKIKDEKLLDEIIDFSYSTIYSHFLEPIDKDKLKSNISKEINSLLSLESKPTSIEHIVCIRTLEDEAEIDDSGHYVITPDVKYHEIYDVWLTQKGDGEHYSLLFAD